jgi:thiol-disulfide isomerase/thioredoxin
VRFDHVFVLGLVLMGCEEKTSGPTPSRFASVKKNTQASTTAFCDKSYASGSKRYVPAPERPFGDGAPKKSTGWTWLNVWATWCKPCVEEMGMLTRWHEAFTRENVPVTFELLSVDESSAQPQLEMWREKNLPGSIRWLRSEEDFGPFLDSLGVDRNAAIPIHVLIDLKGMVRCVRVGAIHEENYGAARQVITQNE